MFTLLFETIFTLPLCIIAPEVPFCFKSGFLFHFESNPSVRISASESDRKRVQQIHPICADGKMAPKFRGERTRPIALDECAQDDDR